MENHVEEIIIQLDKYARDFNHKEYGLPIMLDQTHVRNMEQIIEKIVPCVCSEVERKFLDTIKERGVWLSLVEAIGISSASQKLSTIIRQQDFSEIDLTQLIEFAKKKKFKIRVEVLKLTFDAWTRVSKFGEQIDNTLIVTLYDFFRIVGESDYDNFIKDKCNQEELEFAELFYQFAKEKS